MTKLILWLPIHIALWILLNIIFIPLMLIGWIVIPLAAACEAYEWRSPAVGTKNRILYWSWPWMWLWGNDGDGIWEGEQYLDLKFKFLQIVYWSAFRNPTNNMRFIPWISCVIKPGRVKFIGSFQNKVWAYHDFALPNDGVEWDVAVQKYDTKIPQWFYAWQGPYSNFYWQWRMFNKLWRLWIGWKIYPTDIYGVTEYRRIGAGFALQFKVVT